MVNEFKLSERRKELEYFIKGKQNYNLNMALIYDIIENIKEIDKEFIRLLKEFMINYDGNKLHDDLMEEIDNLVGEDLK